MYTKELNLNCLRVIDPTKEIGVVPTKEQLKVSFTVTTPHQVKQQIKTQKIVRITVILMIVTYMFGAIIGITTGVSETKKCFTLMDYRHHMQSFQVAGGVWQKDYEPYYNELQILAENDEFFAKHLNAPMSSIIFTTLLFIAKTLCLSTSVIFIIVSVYRYAKDKSVKLVL